MLRVALAILLSVASLNAQGISAWDMVLPKSAKYTFVNAETGKVVTHTADGVNPRSIWRLKFSANPDGSTEVMDVFTEVGPELRVVSLRRFSPGRKVEVGRIDYYSGDGTLGIPFVPSILHEGQSGTIINDGTYAWTGLWDRDAKTLSRSGVGNLEKVSATGFIHVVYNYSYALGRLHLNTEWTLWNDSITQTAHILYVYDFSGMIAIAEKSNGEPGKFYVREP